MQDQGIRVISVKGPFLGLDELRPRGFESIDVDVWVDPAAFGDALDQLRDQGWVGGMSTAPHTYPAHSAPLLHQYWEAELDLHRSFPGFLADEQSVFDELWQGRVIRDFCGQKVACPSRPAHLLIAGLHLLRDAGSPRSKTALASFRDRLRLAGLSASELAEVARLAESLGATRTARPVLEMIDVPVVHEPLVDQDHLWRAWRSRSQVQERPGRAWVLALSRTKGRERARLLMRAVWLDRAELTLQNGGRHLNAREVVVAQIRRWWRLVSGIGGN